MGVNNNRRRGNSFEVKVVKDLKEKELDKDATTSRYSSRELDNKKVDICTVLKLNIQCKNYSTRIPYEALLAEMPKEDKVNVVVHKFTKKTGKQFREIGTYAIIKYEDLLDLLSGVKELYDKRTVS